MTLRQAITAAANHLAEDEHLRATATRDAELLLLYIVQISRANLFAYPERELLSDQQTAYQSLIERRLQHEPIQYITGQQEFYGLNFHVTPAVLIPRPETEHLVEAVLKLLPSNQSLKLADIGTGSGAIAIALAAHLPHAAIIALDISPDALAIATTNARENNVADRVRFLQSDLLNAVSQEKEFDAIVSNPPYIPEIDRGSLHPQVRNHEPSTALFAGEAGLDIYRRLIPQAHKALKQNGLLALEIGHGQQDSLAELLSGWQTVSFIDDLQQISRVALARKP
ncbi:peptide chain release factor N(5)-glutamine methyltransferase [Tunturiibacter lichenicola]|jgi:release factor glutamine methyltransferase|uniref:peptide chain release factor N(5)-glutamine methyltransferase n=1 Tax=Tunturiibacter lichenicola TaxID=2051959 RepID=UPI003D9B68F4